MKYDNKEQDEDKIMKNVEGKTKNGFIKAFKLFDLYNFNILS